MYMQRRIQNFGKKRSTCQHIPVHPWTRLLDRGTCQNILACKTSARIIFEFSIGARVALVSRIRPCPVHLAELPVIKQKFIKQCLTVFLQCVRKILKHYKREGHHKFWFSCTFREITS